MSAARDWFAASSRASELQRAAVARLLGTPNRYALMPFAAMRTADGWRLGVALQLPLVLTWRRCWHGNRMAISSWSILRPAKPI
jgi:hypothetical protein